MKFDYIIGNPPYQDETIGDNDTYAPPVYNKFMDASYKIGSKVELIHPARFLFNAGSTPKSWNKKMLNNEHFKILEFVPKSGNIFPTTDIKGGIAISYYSKDDIFEKIDVFTPYVELNTILKKVIPLTVNGTVDSIITGRGVYKLSKTALEEYPQITDIQSKGHKFDVGSGAFKILRDIIFFEKKPTNGKEYVKYLGLFKQKRCYYWTELKYQNVPNSFYK